MISDFSSRSPQPGQHVIYATMNGCPHCVEFSPMVEDASYRVPVPIYVADDTHHVALQSQYGQYIQGFPSLLFVDIDGSVSVFDHFRSPQNVADWISIHANRQTSEPMAFNF